jgi:hypothetical protein
MKTCEQIEEQSHRIQEECYQRNINGTMTTLQRNTRCCKAAEIAAMYQLRVERETGFKYGSNKHKNTPFPRSLYAGW